MQTALRLSDLLEDGNYEDIEKSASMTRVGLKMQEYFFGSDHNDTITTRKLLFNRLFDTGAFQEAYDVALLGLQKLLGWSEEKQTYCGGKEEHKSFPASISAVFFCRGAGMCCLELPGAAKKSIAFFKVHLRYCQNMRGEEHLWCIEPMQKLARAFEMCDERLASIYWLARSVECALRSLEIEGHTFYEGEERERIIWRGDLVKSEAVMEETVACYEPAREKFGPFSELSLRKFLSATDSRIKLWRHDRQIWGSPYNEEASVRTEPAFPPNETEEEFEARIQKDVEEWIRTHQSEESTVVEVEEDPGQLPEARGVVPSVVHI